MYELIQFFGVSNAHDLQVGFDINDCSPSSDDSESCSTSLRNSFDENEEKLFSEAIWDGIKAKTFCYVNSKTETYSIKMFPDYLFRKELNDCVLQIGRRVDGFQTLDTS